MTPLDFASERDESTVSWQRAAPTAALIETGNRFDQFLVTLPDGDQAHLVTLHKDHGALEGSCHVAGTDEKCPARQYNDESKPCAHLCTIWKATLFNDPTADGTPIRLFDVDDAEIAANDTHIEAAMAATGDDGLAADGGVGVRQ